ncbi:relaxase/mobilization nuclease domain-containing protein [uncultured Bradyrhizobium sp.]|uniref:relaxase/mobilization nuclease domain-containing protein n=1 Tax=uncultured Bradyrhizobium sp. TaxID=199684 RepID=UPI00262A84C4|nr:relaxase/mobilization nuclease domain-containing protein [uncultured Bradyrhizobium sp.]
MIIKGQARGRAAQLAAHLLAADENERIRLFDVRGTLARDVKGALVEMEVRGLAAKTKRPLYHASISPEASRPLDDRQIRHAVDTLEEKLGLRGQTRLVVTHRKKGRDHVHVVWSRIDSESGTAIAYSWNYRLHESAARELEAAFGHRRIPGSREKRVERRRRRSEAGYELRQQARSGVAPSAVTFEVTALWSGSSNGAVFKRKLEEAGYTLARGDRRVFVIIDRAGNVHSLARRIQGGSTAALRKRMADVPLSDLPSVSAVREDQRERRVVGDRKHKFALASRETTQRRIGKRTTSDRAHRYFRPNMEGMISVKTDGFVQTPARRRWSGTPLSIIVYRSARAALFADFATRLAAARRFLRGDQLIAAIVALQAERNVALDRLQELQPWRKKREGTARQPRRLRRLTAYRIRRKPFGLK